jgi:hypothetical protein
MNCDSGGLKIWECTLEFCNYIAENPTLVDGLNVLEVIHPNYSILLVVSRLVADRASLQFWR